jgi:hypothetical protein
MHTQQPPSTLLPQVRLFHQALGLPRTPESTLCSLAESLEGGLGQEELLFELRGDACQPEIDLSCFLSATRGMACHLPLLGRLDIPAPWLDLLDLLARQQDSNPERWRDWRGLWLEFDSSLSSRTRPNLFITIANQNNGNRQIVREVLELIREGIGIDPVIDQGIAKLLGDLPPAISVVQTGFLLPRGSGQRVKICLVGITPAEFFCLQQRLGLSLSPQLAAIWSNIMEAQPNWVCALDLYPDGTVTPAFEMQAAGRHPAGGRDWSPILRHLPVPQGALAGLDITEPKIQSCLRSPDWPPLLLQQWRADPTLVDSLLGTALNHIKISSPREDRLQVKYYFLQHPLFTKRQGGRR